MSLDIATLGLEVNSTGVTRASTELAKFEKQAYQAERATTQVNQASDKLGQSLGKLAGIGIGVFTGISLKRMISEVTMAAGRYETLGIVMEQAGKNAKYSASQMHEFEKALVATGIAMTESRELLGRLSAANIDLAQSQKLARAAQDLAVVGGINSTAAFERLVYGITTAQTEILRTIGLNVQFDQSYKELATTLGKSMNALTAQEKLQARVNSTLSESSKYAGIYEQSMTSAFKKLGSLPRYFQDINALAGQLFLDSLGAGVDVVTEKAKTARAALLEMSASGELASLSNKLAMGLQTVVSTTDNLVVGVAALLAIRKLSNAESLKSIALDIQSHGVKATLTDRLLANNAAEQSRIAIINANVAAQRVSLQQDIAKLEMTQLQQAVNVQYLSSLAAKTIGTEHEARAVRLLEAAETELIVTENALSATRSKLAITTIANTKAISLSTAVMNGLKGAGSGLLSLLGGPWGAAFLGATTAAYSLYEVFATRNKELVDAREYMASLSKQAKESGETLDAVTSTISAFNIRDKLGKQLDEANNKLDKTVDTFNRFNLSLQGVTPYERLFGRQANKGFEEVNSLLSSVQKGALDVKDAYIQVLALEEQFGSTTSIVAAKDALGLVVTATDKATKAQNEFARANYQALNTLTEAELKIRGSADAYILLAERMDDAKRASQSFSIAPGINKGELDAFIADKSFQAYLNTLDDKSRSAATSLRTLTGVTQEQIKATIAGEAPTEQLTLAYQASLGAYKATTKETKDATAALRMLEAVEKDIASLSIDMQTPQLKLAQALKDIARDGKEAGVSLSQVTRLQQEYTAAFNDYTNMQASKALEESNLQIMKLTQGTSQLAIAQREATLQANSLKESLMSKGVEEGIAIEQAQKLQDLLISQSQVADNQTSLQFLQEFAALSGDYGLSIQANNELLKQQASIYANTLPPALQVYVQEWERLKKLESATDLFSGLERGTTKWLQSASNLAKDTETMVSSTFNGMRDALVEFGRTGKLNFKDFANSVIADLMRIAVQEAMVGMLRMILPGTPTPMNTKISGMDRVRANYATGGIANVGTDLPHAGGVLTSPTYFYDHTGPKAFAKGGLSLAGEAGTEIFMPAKRMSSGNVGVEVKLPKNNDQGGIMLNQTNNISIQSSGNTGTDELTIAKLTKELKTMTEGVITDYITRQQRSGGMLARGIV